MVGWHHQLNGHEFEQTLGDSEGQGSLECCSPWGHKELDMIKQLNNNNKNFLMKTQYSSKNVATYYLSLYFQKKFNPVQLFL